jgi:hypothetical protein
MEALSPYKEATDVIIEAGGISQAVLPMRHVYGCLHWELGSKLYCPP